MQTSNISSHFSLIHYGWKNPYPTDADTSKDVLPGRILPGIHYSSFSRSRSAIGGTLEVDIFGANPQVNVGDWVVFKTSATGKFTQDNFKSHGLTRFIGQIYSITPSFFADAEGNVRRTYKLNVREWSHVLYVPVRFDQLALESASEEIPALNSVAGIVTGSTGDKNDLFEKLIQAKLNTFETVEALLEIIGGLSADKTKQTINKLDIYKVSTRMPLIPYTLVEDHVITQDKAKLSGGAQQFDSERPWSTGFMWNILGVQEWDKQDSTGLFESAEDIKKSVKLVTQGRPTTFVSPGIYYKGESFNDLLTKKLGPEGYEFYTDLWYIKDKQGVIKVAPVLVVRDNPYSMRGQGVDDRKFSWTYYDDLPKVSVPLRNIVSITPSQTFLNSKNYIRCEYKSAIISHYPNQAATIINGTQTNIASQNRFGGMEMNPIISDLYNVKGEDKSVQDNAANWLTALSQKLISYYSYDYLFPRASILIKDADFPLSVGFNMEIPLGKDRATLVGHIDSIDYRYHVHSDGRHENQTYVKLSRLCMLGEDGKTLQPLPPQGILDLIKLPDDKNGSQFWTLLKKAGTLAKLGSLVDSLKKKVFS